MLAIALGLIVGAQTMPVTEPPEFPEGVKTVHMLVMCRESMTNEWTQCNGFYVLVGADTQFYKLEVD